MKNRKFKLSQLGICDCTYNDTRCPINSDNLLVIDRNIMLDTSLKKMLFFIMLCFITGLTTGVNN